MAASGRGARGEVEVFDYPACPGAPPLPAWGGWVEAPESGAAEEPVHDGAEAGGASGRCSIRERLDEETSRSFEAGRERGRQEGRQAEREAQAAALQWRRNGASGNLRGSWKASPGSATGFYRRWSRRL